MQEGIATQHKLARLERQVAAQQACEARGQDLEKRLGAVLAEMKDFQAEIARLEEERGLQNARLAHLEQQTRKAQEEILTGRKLAEAAEEQLAAAREAMEKHK